MWRSDGGGGWRPTAPDEGKVAPASRRLTLPRGRNLDLDTCRVMAILNATPDSFSDGGVLLGAMEKTIANALDEGADILDVGGESTRPGHAAVAEEEELARVLPVLAAIREVSDVPISIDTRKPGVARAALDAGADIVNDVSGCADPAMARVVVEAGVPVILMRHKDMTGDVVDACGDQLQQVLARAGGARQVILDPGLGFGDPPGAWPEANLRLVREQAAWSQGHPVLIGASRKRFIGARTGREPRDRLLGSVAVAVLAAECGASIVRVHDVAATVEALAAVRA